MATATLEVCILVDRDGNYAVGLDHETAQAAYDIDIGNSMGDTTGHRLINLAVTVPLPVAIELTGTADDDGAPATLAVK